MSLFANVGLPMICVYWPSAWVALLPIILIETWVGVRVLRISFDSLLKAASLGNLVSTIIGIPVTWLVLALIEGRFFSRAEGLQTASNKVYAVTIQSPWLIPYEREMYWMIPAAAVALSIPFFIMSVITEGPIAKWCLPDVSGRDIFRWTCWANAASYLFLCLLVFVLCSINELGQSLFAVFGPLTNFVLGIFGVCLELILPNPGQA